MKATTGSPHDILVHSTLRHARHAASWLRWLVPDVLGQPFDWASLRILSERLHGQALRQVFADLVAELLGHDVRLRVLFDLEHRSHRDPRLHDTMLRYCVHLAHSTRKKRSSPPTAVIGAVLYHGRGPLDLRPRAQRHGLDASASALLDSLQPRVHLLGDDLSVCSEQQILARPLTPLVRLTLLAVRFLPEFDPRATVAALDRWGALLRAVDTDADGPPSGEDAIETFGWYLLHVTETPAEDVHMALERNLQRPEETIMSTAERLRLQGKDQGRAEGKAEGKAEGRAETLLRMLHRRFAPLPPTIEPRLRSATLVELDRWTDRILDATTLDGVFATD